LLIAGCVWRICSESDYILYAVEYNHSRERHLDGAAIESFNKPALLITDCKTLHINNTPRKASDKLLIDHIMSAKERGGSVLLPVDSACRVLELLLVIHSHWLHNSSLMHNYPLIFASHEATNTIEFAKSQIEWMSENCMKQFDLSRENPFNFPHLINIHNINELRKIPKPYCVLATNYTLQTSLAQEILLDFAQDNRNLLLFTLPPPNNTLAHLILNRDKNSNQITFNRLSVVELEGEELLSHQAEQKLLSSQKELESKSVVKEDDEEEEQQANIIETTLVPAVEANNLTNVTPMKRSVSTAGLPAYSFFQPSFYQFPHYETKYNYNEYGQDIDLNQLTHNINKQISPHLPVISNSLANSQPSGNPTQTLVNLPNAELIPSKTVVKAFSFDLFCRVEYLSFTGLSDGRAVKTIISNMTPRSIVLIQGEAAHKAEFEQYLIQHDICKDIFIPSTNLSVASVDSAVNLLRLRLSDELLSTVKFIKLSSQYELAHIQGKLRVNNSALSNTNLQLSNQDLALLTPIPSSQQSSHEALYLGDFKFPELRRILAEGGIKAEFYSGILVAAQGKIRIRKLSPSQLSISGVLCDEYFKVRSLLYSKYTIV
jgi:cleavage and polyadenylation specificity factor subunit 2